MNKKKYYSLTANQRKALRAEQQEKENKKKGLIPKTEEEIANDVCVKKSHKQLWILITAITIGVLLIITAIILPIVLLKNNSKNPIATITFSDGRKVTIDIWEQQCPIIATNFIYLANIGFFDGTIVYDAQRDFVRFGAKTDYNSANDRNKNKKFTDSITNFGLADVPSVFKKNAEKNMFGYRLKPESTTDYTKLSNNSRNISYISNSAADFMINLCADNETNSNFCSQNDNSTETDDFRNYVKAFGRVHDDKSFKILRDIYSLDKSSLKDVNYYWATTPTLKINKIRVDNLVDKKKWNKFVFVQFMNTASAGNEAWNSWNS